MSSCKTTIKKVKDVAEATALVLDWFERENKPVTPQSLTDALGSRVSKPLIQKILDQLLTEEKLCAKDLKKIRFYYLRPAGGAADDAKSSASAHESAAMPPSDNCAVEDEEAAAADEAADPTALTEVAQHAATLADTHRRLARWRVLPSAAERGTQREALEKEICEIEAEMGLLQQASAVVEGKSQSAASQAASARRAVHRYRRARQLWVERRGWAVRLLEASGGDVQSAQEVAALLGCTTDADVGVSFEGTAVALPPQLLRDIGFS